MNWQSFMEPASSGRLCLVLLHSVWQVALLTFLATIIDRLRRNTSVQSSYCLYTGALLASLALLPITFSIVDVSTASQANKNTSDSELTLPTETLSDKTTQKLTSPLSSLASLPFQADVLPVSVVPKVPATPWWLQVAPWCVAVYSVGVLIMFVRVCLGIWYAHRLGTTAQPLAGGPLVHSLHRLQRQWSLRVLPLLKQTEQVVVPKVVGIIRPTILFPTQALTGLSADEMEMILAHELAHICRYDVWVNLLQRFTEAILFLTPPYGT